MKPLFICQLLLIGVSIAPPVQGAIRWDGVVLQPDYSNTLIVGSSPLNSGAIAISSSGNIAHYPGPQGQLPNAAYFANGRTRFIQLRESVLGHAAAITPTVTEAMVAEARKLLQTGVGYVGTPLTETGDHTRTEGQPWGIKFPGVVDPKNTNRSVTTFTNANFIPEDLVNAASYYRATLRVDPANEIAAHGLLRTYYEQMVAFMFAGHNGAERAARLRLSFGDLQAELDTLETYTLDFYGKAADVLRLLTERPIESQLFDGSYLAIPGVTMATNRNRLVDAYARALSHQAETIFQVGRLKQFSNYRNPLLDLSPSAALSSLVTELGEHQKALTERQLLLMLAPELSAPAQAELTRGRYMIDQIQALKAAVEGGRVAFAAAHNQGTKSNPDIQFVFREFTPDFVPFYAVLEGKRSYQQFLEIAEDHLSRAEQREISATVAVREFDVRQDELTKALKDIKDRSLQELTILCGVVRNEGGELVPDLFYSLFSGDERLRRHTYGPGEGTGEIGRQWARINESAIETRVAELELQNIYSQINKKTEVAGRIVEGMTNLAQVFLENGDKLEGLDREAGKVQAEAAIELARNSEASLWQTGISSAMNMGASLALSAAGGGGAKSAQSQFARTDFEIAKDGKLRSQALVVGGLIAKIAWDVFEAHRGNQKLIEAGKIQERLHNNLAEIAARRTHILTLEKAQVQYQQSQQVLLQTEEAVHALLLQAERQKLAILLAEQRSANEFLALQNLFARVQYVLQEYATALELEESNPLRSPDYRLIRDLALREAEDAFHLAHRWVYLAAKSVEYRVNTGSQSELSLIRNLVSGVLRARNASTLRQTVSNLKDTLDTFHTAQNRESSSIEPDFLSLRHHVVQRNKLNPTNPEEIENAELQPGALTSDDHWLAFLQANISPLPDNNLGLFIPFSTSFDPWTFTTNPYGGNPLFSATSHGELIDTIEVQVVGRSLTLPVGQLRYGLRYLGASAVRLEECLPSGKRAVRYFNIRRPDGSFYRTDGALGINSWLNSGTTGFREFSPGNDRWMLEITTDLPNSAGNRSLITSELNKIKDLRIRFRTQYFPADRCD